MERTLPQLEEVFRALCDKNRAQILTMLRDKEMCACKILEHFDMRQPTLSHHMKVLCDAQLVTCRRESRWAFYQLNQPVIQELMDALGALQQEKGPALPPPAPQGKTRLYVLTGFLGSGKTTLLLRLLTALTGRRVGVIQNEFGKLGIDGQILQRGDVEMVELNRGSIFCSCLKLSFVQALADMAKQNLDYLFVESSGLGDPSNYQEILDAARELAGDRYDFQGAICLIDAVNFMEQLRDMETVERQLKHCHLAVVTKVDLIGPEKMEELKEAIRKINPLCPIRTCTQGDLDLSFLGEDLLQYSWAEGEESTNTEEQKPKTISLWFDGVMDKGTLDAILQAILPHAYRIKGFFHLEEGWNQVDVVGDRIDHAPCQPHEKSQLVFISRIGPQIIKKVMEAWQNHTEAKMELKN